MQLFYTPDITNNNNYTLSVGESKHAIRVLRLKIDDNVTLVDGNGTFYHAVIVNDNPKQCEVSISKNTKEHLNKPSLHIAIAPTKNNDRTEWFIEKCTEIGINEITPILCRHSERKKIKQERFMKVAWVKKYQCFYQNDLAHNQTIARRKATDWKVARVYDPRLGKSNAPHV